MGIDPSLEGPLKAFLRQKKIKLELTNAKGATVRVVRAERPAPSTMKTLRAGGWIACPTALALAPRLGIRSKDLGQLLNFLKIKIRHCSLGCF